MKKIYFLAATALTLTAVQAQTSKSFLKPNTTTIQKASLLHSKSSNIRFEQAPDFENAIISMVNLSNEIFAADDFKISTKTNVDKFIFYGFQDYDDFDENYRGLKLYLFEDNNGKPAGIPSNAAGAVAVIDINEESSAGTVERLEEGIFTITVDVTKALGSTLALDADKKYWVAFAPNVYLYDEYGADPYETFYWSTGAGQFEEPVLIDEGDLFGAGATTWSTISSLTGDPFEGLAFTITGETALGTGEVYSNVKPVMATQQGDLLHIFTKNDKLKSADIYATDGKKVASGTVDKLNIGQLPKGVYILNVTLASGKTESTKFIKR